MSQTIFIKEQLITYIEKFFLVFIFIQPLLDISVYMGLQISNLIRVLALLVGFLYFTLYPNKKMKWLSIGYFVILGLFMLVHIVNNLSVKDPYFFSEELTYGVKSAYVAAMLVIYTAVFLSIKEKFKWDQIIQRGITFNLILIGIVMVLATLTDSGKRSYAMLAKEGHSGWFFSANEISAILGMGFGIMLIYIISKKELWKKLALIPFVSIVGWSMLTLGTKVGMLSLYGLLAVGVVLTIIELIFKRKNAINAIFLVLLLALSVLYLPSSAVGNNLNITFADQEDPVVNNTPAPSNNVNNGTVNQNPNSDSSNSSSFVKKALSGRDFFFKRTLEDYREAPFSQKLLGMGPGGNYEKRLKLIEMDFLDWFFSYGVLGFSILILPILVLGFTILKNLFQNRFRQMNSNLFMVATEVALAIGISFFAGHIFLNPASGIYFSILLSYLFVLTTDSNLIDRSLKEI